MQRRTKTPSERTMTTEQTCHPLGTRTRDGDRHAHPRRSRPVGQHHERALPGVDGRTVERLAQEKDTDQAASSSPRPRRRSSPAATSSSSSQAEARATPKTHLRGRRASSSAQLRTLETLGMPVVAALNGTALGGGLEIALACHRRIAIDDPKAEFGLPEVTLGLLPGGGGVVRTVRLLGFQSALMNVLLQGQRMKPAQAKAVGLIDELVADRDALMRARRASSSREPAAEAAVGRERLQDARAARRRTPALAAQPSGVPRQPTQAAQGRQLPGAQARSWPRPSKARRSTSTTRDEIESRYFVELAHRQGREEHDQGVLLRPAEDQRRRQPRPKDVAAVDAQEGRHPRRRHDGRRHRLRDGAWPGISVRAQGRLRARPPNGQGLLRRSSSTRRSRKGRMTREKRRRHARRSSRPPRAPTISPAAT